MKRIVSIVLTAALVMGMGAVAFAAPSPSAADKVQASVEQKETESVIVRGLERLETRLTGNKVEVDTTQSEETDQQTEKAVEAFYQSQEEETTTAKSDIIAAQTVTLKNTSALYSGTVEVKNTLIEAATGGEDKTVAVTLYVMETVNGKQVIKQIEVDPSLIVVVDGKVQIRLTPQLQRTIGKSNKFSIVVSKKVAVG